MGRGRERWGGVEGGEVLVHEVPGGLLGISILDVSAIMILWC